MKIGGFINSIGGDGMNLLDVDQNKNCGTHSYT